MASEKVLSQKVGNERNGQLAPNNTELMHLGDSRWFYFCAIFRLIVYCSGTLTVPIYCVNNSRHG